MHQQQESRKSMMLLESIPHLVSKMAFPTIIAFLINSIYSLADTYFVSSLGTNATAAVSVNASLDQIIMMAGSLLAIGAGSYAARLLGQREEDEASRVLSTAFFLAMGFGLLVLILGTAFMRPMVRLLGATSTCASYAMDYAGYVLLAAPFMAANFVMNQCLRAEGSAVLSMFGLGFGGILNCILDPIFIFGLDMGVAGASLATAISKLISFAILIFPYITKRSLLRLSIPNFKPSRTILAQVVTIGSSSFLRSLLAIVSAIVLNNIAGEISDSVLAGIGVTTKVMNFPLFIILGFCQGFQPVAGFNWGAKRYDRVLESFRFAAKTVLIGASLIAILIALFAGPIIQVFADADSQMQQVGMLSIRLQCLALPIHAWVCVVNLSYAAIGRPLGALLLSTARQGSCLLPIIPLLNHFLGWVGVAAAQALADGLSLFIALPLALRFLRELRALCAEGAKSGEPSGAPAYLSR